MTSLFNDSVSDFNVIKGNAESNLQAQSNTILNNISSAQQSALNSISTNAQNYVNQARSYAEQAQNTVDNRVSLEHLNQSKALETGSISDDSDVLPWIKYMAHSTFDISKFNVYANGSAVSNPTVPFSQNGLNITTDGIVSGFSSGNYLDKRLTFTPQESLEWYCKFTIPTSLAETQTVIRFYNNKLGTWQTNAIQYRLNNGQPAISLVFTDSDKEYYTANANTTYIVYMKFTAISSVAKIYDENMNLLQTYNYTTSPILMKGNNSLLTIGHSSNQGDGDLGQYFGGSIDLKYLQVIVDGVPVFSGNKTGIDTIKADDFEAEGGTPTISDDGILTINTNGLGVKYPISRTSTDKFKIEMIALSPESFSSSSSLQ